MLARVVVLVSILIAVCIAPVRGETVQGEAVETIDWDLLMPEDYSPMAVFDTSQFSSLDDYDPMAEIKLKAMMEALSSAPVVKEMDGRMIRIPGFVVPLVEEGQSVTEFFLVPYFGACIHVPPPPSNQIIHVTFEPGVNVENLYDAIWVVGKLSVETTIHQMGTSGYTMDAFKIEAYKE
ncbi:hypothetical protein SAMN03080615_01529 [Amphritea atlantica]|uniref:DUF3299 domain-containing protein n=1 Tax=Amphritea atlantica TaxID=355243 RepID=A0A1H9FZE3_9GAMM|nr:hypothetical protein SAMN03080615_01529 [Amphritea atlantica]